MIVYLYFLQNRFKGCYDLLCSGFIQITNKIALGGAISPLSIYHGDQFDIDVFVLKVVRLKLIALNQIIY